MLMTITHFIVYMYFVNNIIVYFLDFSFSFFQIHMLTSITLNIAFTNCQILMTYHLAKKKHIDSI